MPFGMKLHFSPAKVVKHQYLGKRKKCGNAARKMSFSTVFYRISGQTTGPILIPFCIRTTYWSRTWLGVFFSKISKNVETLHIYAYFGFYSIYTSKNMQNYWTDFDALLHTSYILVSDVTRHIFFKNLKIWQPCTHICIFHILRYNSKTIHPDLTRFHI